MVTTRLFWRCLLLLLLLSLLAGASRAEATVTVSVAAGQLVVTGDAGPNQITVRSIPFNASRLEVLDGSVSLGTFARSTFTSISISGLGGDDVITLSGPFPIIEPAAISGGAGNDTIDGGAGPDTLFGGSGNDRILWSPIEGADVISGGDDIDRLEVTGTAAADTIARATVTFLPEGGTPVTKTATVPAGSRVTLNIAGEDPALANAPVATAVESTQPILVERARYWPFTPDRWHEAHNSFGSTSVASKWGLAEGRVGGPEGYQTFILLANADSARAADVRITFLRVNGTTVTRSFTVAAASRLTVRANEVTELADESFGAVIEVTSGPGIFVERALYSNSQGVIFAAGTNALATHLP